MKVFLVLYRPLGYSVSNAVGIFSRIQWVLFVWSFSQKTATKTLYRAAEGQENGKAQGLSPQF